MGRAQRKSRTVLIVEDDAELRSVIATLFEDEQLEGTCPRCRTEPGRLAHGAVKAARPDLT
jgi:CheY-like chemotaxis protein